MTPKLDCWKMAQADMLTVYFTREVSFSSLQLLVIDDEQNIAIDIGITAELLDVEKNESIHIENKNNLACAPIKFSENTVVGKKYILVGTAQDEYANTLDFTLSFMGYNSIVPAMIFSEVRTEYSKSSTGYRVEYIEFVVLSDGNTAGMQFISAYDGEDTVYTFPYIEVKAGDYIVLHMRNLEESCVSELEDDLLLSTAKDSSTARDLWVSNTTARIGKDDVLLLYERQNGTILDAFLYSRSGKDEWAKDRMLIAAKKAYNAGVWKNGFMPADATISDGLTLTRTLSRQNVSECVDMFVLDKKQPLTVLASDWFVVNTSGCTPGEANSTIPYIP